METETSQASLEPLLAKKPRAITWGQWERVVLACTRMTPVLADLLKQFWGIPVKVTFFSASTRNHYYWQADDFHVTQLMLPVATPETQAMAWLRISDMTCAALLNRVLGPRPNRQFSFKQLSPLEGTLLNEFSRDLLTSFMKHLIRKPGKKTRLEAVNLIWLVQPAEAESPLGEENRPLRFREPMDIGKILLTLPIGAIKTEPAPDAARSGVPDDFFFHVETMARLRIGRTRIALSDLDQLEEGDLVVCEESQADRLYLVEPDTGTALPFTADIAHPEQITIPLTQDIDMMDTQQHLAAARQRLWDNLMIEVDAEFTPVKLPLKQLKQMTEGLVVEMGDLIHNEVCLSVEGKPLAYGELVIVGDKFGVRIREVKSDEEASGEPGTAMAAPPAEPPPPPPSVLDLPAPPGPAAQTEDDDTFMDDDNWFDDETYDDEEDA